MKLSDLFEETDHKVGDKERFRKVSDRYKELLSRIKELRGMTGFKERNPGLHKTLMAGMQKELEDMKPYFKTYSMFRNTKEDDDMNFVFKEGLTLVKAWFEGWYMSRRSYDKIGPLIRTFKAIQKICPAHDMILFRVVAVEDARQAQKLKMMQTGPRSLQSWTTSMKAAKIFFNTQYSEGQTMIVDNDGHIEYVDKLVQRDYVIVKAKFSAHSIYWTPTTMDDLWRYDMHCVDSKLYPYHRIPDAVSNVLYEYSGQQEVVVNVEGNGEVPVMVVYPIHIRNEMSNDPNDERIFESMKAPEHAYQDFWEQVHEIASKMEHEYRSGAATQPWKLVPAAKLVSIWKQAAKDGFVRNERGLEEIAQQMIENTQRLYLNTAFAGHTHLSLEEAIDNYDINVDDPEKFMEWAIDLPSGGWRISDYGLNPLIDYAVMLLADPDEKQKMAIIDLMLQVTHQRSNLATWFVEGGTATLDRLFAE